MLVEAWFSRTSVCINTLRAAKSCFCPSVQSNIQISSSCPCVLDFGRVRERGPEASVADYWPYVIIH